MAVVNINSTYSELLEFLKEENFSRIPVYDEDIDDIVGYNACKRPYTLC